MEIIPNYGFNYPQKQLFMIRVQLTAVSGNQLEFSNGEIYSFDLLAYTPKHEVPQVRL